MKVELVQVAYPEYPPMDPLPEIEGEEGDARKAREQAHKETYQAAKAAYDKAHKWPKELLEVASCRLDGCPNTAKAGLKFCRRDVGIRSQLKKEIYKKLDGPGIKVRISE